MNTDFNKFLPAQSRQMNSVSTIPATLTITPSTILTIISTAGDIQNIIPPIEGYHELNFLMGVDLIFFISGGNISIPVSPVSLGAGYVTKLFFNPINSKYYIVNVLLP